MWLTSMSGEGSDHTVNNIRLSQDYMLYVLEIKELKKDFRINVNQILEMEHR